MSMVYNFTDEEVNGIIQMWRDNYTRFEISKKYNYPDMVIYKRIILKQKIIRNYQDKDWLIQKNYVEKKTFAEMAKEARCSTNSIQKSFRKFGLTANSEVCIQKQYECDEDYFENIDSQDKAYWYGYILADGHIEEKNVKKGNTHRLSFCISEKDYMHLEKFKESLKCNIPIKFYTAFLQKIDKEYRLCSLKINRKKIVDDLKSHGLTVNKSLNEQPPIWMNKELIRHFIRGYFDGDGCISYSLGKKNIWNMTLSFNIVSGYKIIKFIYDTFINELNVKTSLCRDKNNKDLFYISCGNKESIITIMNWLYKNSNIHLDRKFNTYLMYLNIIGRSENIV